MKNYTFYEVITLGSIRGSVFFVLNFYLPKSGPNMEFAPMQFWFTSLYLDLYYSRTY